MKKIIYAFVGCLLASSLLTGCTTSPRIASILILDKSASAIEDEEFSNSSQTACQTVAKNLQPNDLSTQPIAVDGEPPKAADLAPVGDNRIYLKNCRQHKSTGLALTKTTTRGTRSCPAWDLAYDLSHRPAVASLPVLYVSAIQTNELEKPCPKIWRKLAQDAEKRGGKLVIVGSSVGGGKTPALNNNFNRLLWQQLKDFSSVTFCEESSVRACIKEAAIQTRH